MDAVIKWYRTRQANVKSSFLYGQSSSFYAQDTTAIIPLFIHGFFRGTIAGGLTWFIGHWWVDSSSFKLSDWANYVGTLTMLFYWLLPLGQGILNALFFKQDTTPPVWYHFSKKYRAFASGVIAFLLLWSTYILSPLIEPYFTSPVKGSVASSSLKKLNNTGSKTQPGKNKQRSKETHFQSSSFFKGQTFLLVTLPLTTLGVFGTMQLVSITRKRKPLKLKAFSTKALTTKERPFRLWLGESTGWLADFGHTTSLAPYQQIGLGLNEATQNILVMGAIGAGKTTRVINPLLLQLLDQDCGGLIFDIKGDFKKAVKDAASMTQKELMIIGVGQVPLNLLAGLSPEMASSFLKSALLLSGSGNLDSFWIDTATELCRNMLGVLSFFPEHYHLRGLYQALFDEDFQTLLNDVGQQKVFEESERRRLSAYQHYIQAIFARFDEKIRNGVLASVSQVLSLFQHPELIDTFCANVPESVSMESILNEQVILIDMPLAQWGLAGKVIYTFIKLRFFNVMQQRALREDWNQNRPVFFMCDEYQEIVSCNKDGLSHAVAKRLALSPPNPSVVFMLPLATVTWHTHCYKTSGNAYVFESKMIVQFRTLTAY